jgi:hypothetical protein
MEPQDSEISFKGGGFIFQEEESTTCKEQHHWRFSLFSQH